MKHPICTIFSCLVILIVTNTAYPQGKISFVPQPSTTKSDPSKKPRQTTKPSKRKHSAQTSATKQPVELTLDDIPFFIFAGNEETTMCFSRNAWLFLDDDEKAKYWQLGVVVPGSNYVGYNGQGRGWEPAFIMCYRNLPIGDKVCMTWDDLMMVYPNYVPSIGQARAISKFRSEINKTLSIIDFAVTLPTSGMNIMYWTNAHVKGYPIVFMPGDYVVADVASDTEALFRPVWHPTSSIIVVD